MVIFLFAVAIFEELFVRGIVFRLLEQALGTWLAIGVSAVVFGFGHRGNPGATLVSSVGIAIEAGVLFAAVYVATRSLWIPVGLHWAWNLFEGPVWGARVSGNEMPALLTGEVHGPELLTGGSFGPEAGLVCILFGTGLGAAFLVLAVRREQIIFPAWMRWVGERLRGAPRELPPSAPAPALPPSPL